VRAAYTHHEPLTFPDFIDQETGKTLTAEPGRVYDITPASGRLAGEIPEPWFVRVGDGGEPVPAAEPDAFPEEPAEPEPAPEPVLEPGTEGQSF
jgi:hypothetical protein